MKEKGVSSDNRLQRNGAAMILVEEKMLGAIGATRLQRSDALLNIP
jgi:hypothetical protein